MSDRFKKFDLDEKQYVIKYEEPDHEGDVYASGCFDVVEINKRVFMSHDHESEPEMLVKLDVDDSGVFFSKGKYRKMPPDEWIDLGYAFLPAFVPVSARISGDSDRMRFDKINITSIGLVKRNVK